MAAITNALGAVIVAGGSAERLGGADKRSITVGEATLLDHVRAAVQGADEIVVMGPEAQGGPVAALAAGIDQVAAPVVATLAVDQPLIAGAIQPLLQALSGHDVAVLVRDGRRQYLAAIWRRDALISALASLDSPVGAPMRRLFESADVAEVADRAQWSLDVDTPEDLEQARQLLQQLN